MTQKMLMDDFIKLIIQKLKKQNKVSKGAKPRSTINSTLDKNLPKSTTFYQPLNLECNSTTLSS